MPEDRILTVSLFGDEFIEFLQFISDVRLQQQSLGQSFGLTQLIFLQDLV